MARRAPLSGSSDSWITQHCWPGCLPPATPNPLVCPRYRGWGAWLTLPASPGGAKGWELTASPPASALKPDPLCDPLIAFFGCSFAPPACTLLGHQHCCPWVLLSLVANTGWREQTVAACYEEKQREASQRHTGLGPRQKHRSNVPLKRCCSRQSNSGEKRQSSARLTP